MRITDETTVLFADAAGNLSTHFHKEESILFPYIRMLEATNNGYNNSNNSVVTGKFFNKRKSQKC